MKRYLLEAFEDVLIVLYWPLAFLAAVWGLQFMIWCGRVYRAEHRQAYIVWSLRNNQITNRLLRRWLYYQCPGCGEYYTGLEKRDRGWYCHACHERLDVEFREWVAKQIDSGNVPPSVMLHRLKTKGTMDAAALWIVVFILVVAYLFVRLFLQ